MSFLADNFALLRDAFLTTLALAVLSGICALVIGTLLTAMRVSPVAQLRAAATDHQLQQSTRRRQRLLAGRAARDEA